jgi:pyruvate dehydrogenase E2 component (dihydrolipoamide acetyltransferase)
MPTEFKIPELGENVSAGDVVKVLVKAGDTIEKDQPVLELETDKATIEVPSSVSGTVQEIKVKPGDKVKVGQVVLTVGDGAATGKAAAKAEAPAAKAEEAPESAGKTEEPAQSAARSEESQQSEAKAAPEGSQKQKSAAASAASASEAKPQPAGAAEDGGLSQAATPERTDEEGEGAAQGESASGRGEDEGQPRQNPRGEVVDINRGVRAAPPAAGAEPEAPRTPAAPAAPSVRRLARELGVDIARVSGSGPAGRISTEDLHAYVKSALSNVSAGGGQARGAVPLPDFSKWGEVERKPMSNIRRKTSEHLGNAWNVIPHVTQHDRADITAVEGLRKRYAPQAETAGGKLTMTAIALKIVAGALQRFPQFNSSIDPEKNEIVYKKAIHVGVAADTPRGLLVPVVRDVDRKGIFELAKDLAVASDKSRAGKLGLDDMQGAGFTITNLGGIGGTSFTPIVNWPEVAILGISRATWEPIWRPASVEDEGTFEPRLMLPLSLSYDHRVIDGADAARFLRWVCEAFEQPFVLVL